MPGIGGLSIANNLLANNIQLNLNRNQDSLKKLTQQLSSGLRVNGPQDDPSGFVIATDIETQVQGLDQAVLNIQDAQNAANVASGSLTSVTSILQKIRSLAVQSASNLLSQTDLGNVQAEVQQLVQEVNSISQNTSFNGVKLLDGHLSGYVPQTNASANITQNSPLNTSNLNLIDQVTYTVNDLTITDGTFQFKVVENGGTIATQVFFISSGVNGLIGTLLTTVAGGAATSYAYNDITITINAVGTADLGSTAAIKILQYVSAGFGTTPEITIQTGPEVGNSISFGIQGVTASALRIGGLNVEAASNPAFNAAASQDTIGQVDLALDKVLTIQALIGAAGIRLGFESDNNNTASTNLKASESAIRDLNVAQASSEYTKQQLLVNFGTSLLAQANVNAQSVLQLFR